MLLLYLALIALVAIAPLTAARRPGLTNALRLGLPIPLILIVYETLGQSISHLNGLWIEPHLIRFDQWLLGADASVYLERYFSPNLLDAAHIAYVTYYLLPVGLLALLFRRRRAFERAVTAVALTFYLNYALYFLFPAVGPRATPAIASQYRYSIAEAGGPVSRFVNKWLDIAELTRQDCFPSAHASIAVLCAAAAFVHRLKARWLFALACAAILFSALFLRYHYTADLIAGVLFGGAVAWFTLRKQLQPEV